MTERGTAREGARQAEGAGMISGAVSHCYIKVARAAAR